MGNSKANEYRAKAAKCIAKANTGKNTGFWLTMASQWTHMAEILERIN